MKKYYCIIVATMYDGLEFHQHFAFEREHIVTQKQAETEASLNVFHSDTGEEVESVELIEISKREYNILKKFHI